MNKALKIALITTLFLTFIISYHLSQNQTNQLSQITNSTQPSKVSIVENTGSEPKYFEVTIPAGSHLKTDGRNLHLTLEDQTEIITPFTENQILNLSQNQNQTLTINFNDETYQAKIYENDLETAYFFENFKRGNELGLYIKFKQNQSSNETKVNEILNNFNYTSI